VTEPDKSDESKQKTQLPDTGVVQPVTPPPQQPPATHDTGSAGGDPNPPQPILVRVVGGDDLKPFEEQTLAVSRKTYWIAIFGFLAAAAAAVFIGVQVRIMSYQTQVMGSQSESAAAGAAIGELNTRKQLAVGQQQAKAAQESVDLVRRQFALAQRPWVGSGEVKFRQPPTFYVYPTNPIPGTQLNLWLDIPIKNVGLSPAIHVGTEIGGTLSETIAAPPTLSERMQFTCTLADNDAKQVGGMLLPNTPETRVERNAAIGVPLVRVTEVHRIWIVICIAYSETAAIGGHLHHTKIWMASYPINGPPGKISENGRVIEYSPTISQWGLIRTEAD